ncbi:MAG: GNAT family N-acetyltransferase [Anaerolineae bacterium]|nr:GNAT family N-acetyltransferase [Anaerolineae bacterium]
MAHSTDSGHPLLEGLLVDLTPFDKRFVELEHKWENGPAAFWGDMGDRQFFTRDHLRSRRERNAAERENDSSPAVTFGIQTKDSTPIGLFVVAYIQPAFRTAILGAYIGEPEYWGGGYGTDALLLVVDYAFDWLDLRRLWLVTMSLNARVLRQMDKVGFTMENRQRNATLADGTWYDIVMYGLLRDEWPGRAAMLERLNLWPRAQATKG